MSTFYVERFLSTSLSVFFVPPNLTPSSFVLSLPSYLKARVPNTNSGGTLERLTRKLKLSTVHRSQKKVFDKDRNAPILDQQERGRMKLSKSILKSSQKKLSVTTIGNRAAKTMRVTPSSSQVRQMLLWHFSFGEPGRGHPSAGVFGAG